MMLFRRNAQEWRLEDGPGYQLRQYHRGRPTGRVATVSWDSGTDRTRDVVSNQDVWLIVEQNRIAIIDRQGVGHEPTRMRIPLRSCEDATLVDEPAVGLPGAGRVRLDLTIRLGGPVTLRLWFATQDRSVLAKLVRRIEDRSYHRTAVTPTKQRPSVPPLSPLAAHMAPDDDDWVTFRAAPDSTDAVVERHTSQESG